MTPIDLNRTLRSRGADRILCPSNNRSNLNSSKKAALAATGLPRIYVLTFD